MSIIKINLGGRSFSLSCPAESHQQLFSLAEKLDSELNQLKQQNPSASFELLLVMLSIKLLDSKEQKITLEGGELLKEVNNNFQATLVHVYDELKIVVSKLKNAASGQ